jgi:hypothetical protein
VCAGPRQEQGRQDQCLQLPPALAKAISARLGLQREAKAQRPSGDLMVNLPFFGGGKRREHARARESKERMDLERLHREVESLRTANAQLEEKVGCEILAVRYVQARPRPRGPQSRPPTYMRGSWPGDGGRCGPGAKIHMGPSHRVLRGNPHRHLSPSLLVPCPLPTPRSSLLAPSTW